MSASPNCHPLDSCILANARASLTDAEILTAQGYHAEALLFAREAVRKLQLALAVRDRAALGERLIADREPLLSADRDNRQAEAE